MPAGEPWQKGSTLTASAIERASLVSKAISSNPRFSLSTREIEYQQEFPAEDFVLLLGSDALNGIPTWRDYEELLQSIDLVVAIRPGEQLSDVPGAHLRVIESEMFDISSTVIRRAAKSGADLAKFVPEVIANEVERIYGA